MQAIDRLGPNLLSEKADVSGALNLARQMLSPFRAGRVGVPKAIILVTDTPSSENLDLIVSNEKVYLYVKLVASFRTDISR